MTVDDVANDTAVAKPYSYDEVLYPNNPFQQSHPDRIATIATLFGMQPKPIDRCRVLELGCGRGGNLLPMVEQLPESQFVGIELSRVQISEAQQLAKELGCQNVELKHMNILDVDASIGEFDYIITHGVFSWVPREVQEKILDICASQLAPQGVAYVSYNTYPGWNMRRMIRDMTCYHSRRFKEPKTRIEQARALLDFMAQHTSDKTPFGMFLKHEVEGLRGHDDGYLYHEHLEDVNEPIYFYEFAERAEAHGLRYLGETDMSVMYTGHFPVEVTKTLESVASNFIQMEQYMDFIRNRMFRQTLLRRQEVAIDRELRPADLEHLYVASPMTPENPEVALNSPEPIRFRDPVSGRVVNAISPLLKAAFLRLAEVWPGSLSYPELVTQSRRRVDRRAVVSASQIKVENDEFGKDLLRFYVNNLIELHSQPAWYATSAGVRPKASRLARIHAEQGYIATTLRHGGYRLNEFQRYVLMNLDGTRDRTALIEVLWKLVVDNVLVIQGDTRQMTQEQARARLAEALEQTLAKLARAALFLPDSDGRGSQPSATITPGKEQEQDKEKIPAQLQTAVPWNRF